MALGSEATRTKVYISAKVFNINGNYLSTADEKFHRYPFVHGTDEIVLRYEGIFFMLKHDALTVDELLYLGSERNSAFDLHNVRIRTSTCSTTKPGSYK